MRLIDADAIPYVDLNSDMPQSKIRVYVAFKERIDRLPTIDPVKHGKWIKDGEACALYKCSACNDLCTVAGWANCIPEKQMYKAFKFCPNCGARMEKDD